LAWPFPIAPTARSQQLPALAAAGVQSQPLDVGRWDPAVPLEGARDPSEEPSAPPVVVAENDAFTWNPVPPPLPSGGHSAIYDPLRDRILMFGAVYSNDVWELPLSGASQWRVLTTAGVPPSVRDGATVIYDPVRDRMIVFGGCVIRCGQCGPNQCDNGVWALSLSGYPTWSQIVTAGSPPPSRNGHTAIYDPVRDRLVVYVGLDPT